MRLINPGQLPMPPHRCAVFPHRNVDPDGFFDTGQQLTGWHDHVYVSVEAVRTMHRQLPDHVDGGEHEAVLGELEELRAAFDEQSVELESLRGYRAAVVGLESEGYQVRKRTGRPPKAKEAVNA